MGKKTRDLVKDLGTTSKENAVLRAYCDQLRQAVAQERHAKNQGIGRFRLLARFFYAAIKASPGEQIFVSDKDMADVPQEVNVARDHDDERGGFVFRIPTDDELMTTEMPPSADEAIEMAAQFEQAAKEAQNGSGGGESGGGSSIIPATH